MDRRTEDMENRALLEQLLEMRRGDVRSGRITAIAVVVLAAALIVCLALTVPKLVNTIEEAHATLSQTQELIQRANESLDALDQMTESISSIVAASTEKIDQAAAIINSLDLEAFSGAIQKLSAALESLSGFRLFG